MIRIEIPPCTVPIPNHITDWQIKRSYTGNDGKLARFLMDKKFQKLSKADAQKTIDEYNELTI